MRRRDDLALIRTAIEADIVLEGLMALGRDTSKAQTDFDNAKAAAKAATMRLSDKQIEVTKMFFGDPNVDYAKFQTATEMFNNFALVAKFAEALDRIKQSKQMMDEINAAIKAHDDAKVAVLKQAFDKFAADGVVQRGPDSASGHIAWPKFADIAIDFDFQADFWRNLKPILAKGTAITVQVLDKTKLMKLTQPEIQAIRNVYDPLKPTSTDTDAEKKRKIMEIDKKLQELIKSIFIDKKVIAQLPGFDSRSTIRIAVASASCINGSESQLMSQLANSISLQSTGSDLFGFGADNRGLTYLLQGSTTGSQAQFVISGFGLAPGLGQGLAVYQGSVTGDVTSGTVDGIISGTFPGTSDACTWSGTFQIQPRMVCDIDGNGTVDRNDLSTIFAAHNTPATSGDPRDADGDGTITVNDVRFCSLRCTKAGCVP